MGPLPLLLLLALSIWPAQSLPRAGCTISLNSDLSDPQPLVLRPEGGYGTDAFFLPTRGDTIYLAEDQLVDVACPNGNVVLGGSSTGSLTGQARCTSGSFSIGGQILPFSAITCSGVPYNTARFTGKTCIDGNREIEIGFIVGSRFIRIIIVCFDQTRQHSLYSLFNQTKTIGGYQSGYPRPSWMQGSGFFNVGSTSVDTLYTQARQRITINNLLGLPVDSYKYIGSGDLFLARGHLAAKADFLYGSQQRATFYFVNAAPQWQIFNGLNWNDLEQNVRNFVSKRGIDVEEYTGSYGITTLPHATTGVQVELYLYVNGEARGIPVPRLFWKILYEPISKAGVVFIGVNNPYVLHPELDVICPNVCDQYDWLTWNPTNITLGYSYCCSVPDFRRTVTSFPNIEVRQLLT